MIGIFDSGVGGMTVAHAIARALPGYRFVYFGDVARTPYGSKSPETIAKYARENTQFLIDKGARAIIVACNTAASIAAEALRAEFDLPIFDVIGPAVEKVSQLAQTDPGKTRRVGVIGTRATVTSGVYDRLIRAACPGLDVVSQECPLLVPLVEEGWLDKRETKMILRRYLHPVKAAQVQALVLGCTHYPLLKHLITPRIGRRVQVIDSSEEVAATLRRFLDEFPEEAARLERGDAHEFYVSDVTEAAMATARRIFGRPIELVKS